WSSDVCSSDLQRTLCQAGCRFGRADRARAYSQIDRPAPLFRPRPTETQTMTDNRNVIIAIVLSMIVLFGWQFFVAGPQLERAQQQAQIAAEQAQSEAALATPTTTVSADGATAPSADGPAAFADRAAALAASQRITIDTEDLHGSINLTGARLDDLELKQYRETVDPQSPIITLLTPAGAPGAYFAEQGFVPGAGADIAVPDGQSVWAVEGNATALSATTPVTLR